jgi:hypothetical protein
MVSDDSAVIVYFFSALVMGLINEFNAVSLYAYALS